MSLKDLFNKPVSEVIFNIQSLDEIEKISNLINKKGTTEVKINFKDGDNKLLFKLKNKRHIDRKSINMLRNDHSSTIIY